jgi:hypothetical protein
MDTHSHGSPAAPLTRRAFVRSGGMLALGLTLPGRAIARAKAKRPAAWYRRSSYHRLVGQWFTVHGSPVRMRLEAVRDLNAGQKGAEESFGLLFRAPVDRPLPSQVPLLHHHSTGHFHLFFSSTAWSGRGRTYYAVINRARG